MSARWWEAQARLGPARNRCGTPGAASLVGQVASAVEGGLDLEATQSAVALGTYRERLAGDDPIARRAWDNFTIERAWLEARGELPD